MAKPDLMDYESTLSAITNYFDECIKSGRIPGNEGLYKALGIDRVKWFHLRNGNSHKAAPECVDLINRAVILLAAFREQLLFLPDDKIPVHPGRLRTWIKLYDIGGCQPKHHKPHPKRKKVEDDGEKEK